MVRIVWAASAALVLCGCGGANSVGGGVLGLSAADIIRIPTPPTPPTGLTPTDVVSPDGGGFSFGVLSDGLFAAQAYAQLLPVTLPAAPSTGTASMDGTYSLSRVPLNTGPTIKLPVAVEGAPIALAADFAAGTLTGTDGDLTVDGTITTGILTGSVTFTDFPAAQLSGVVGKDRAIGTYIGTATDEIIAGGFDVSN